FRQTTMHAFNADSSWISRLPRLERLMTTRTLPTSFIDPCQSNCNNPQYCDYNNDHAGIQEAGQKNTYQYDSRNEKGKPEKKASYSVILPLLMVGHLFNYPTILEMRSGRTID